MHNTHEITLGKASAKNPTIYIIIQGGNTYELYKALALTTSQLSVQSSHMLTGNLGFSPAFLYALQAHISLRCSSRMILLLPSVTLSHTLSELRNPQGMMP